MRAWHVNTPDRPPFLQSLLPAHAADWAALYHNSHVKWIYIQQSLPRVKRKRHSPAIFCWWSYFVHYTCQQTRQNIASIECYVCKGSGIQRSWKVYRRPASPPSRWRRSLGANGSLSPHPPAQPLNLATSTNHRYLIAPAKIVSRQPRTQPHLIRFLFHHLSGSLRVCWPHHGPPSSTKASGRVLSKWRCWKVLGKIRIIWRMLLLLGTWKEAGRLWKSVGQWPFLAAVLRGLVFVQLPVLLLLLSGWWGSLGTRRDVEDNDSGLAHEMINEMNDRAKTGRLHHWMLHSRAWPVATTWWLAEGWGWGGSMSNGKRFYDDFCVVEKVEQVSQITRELKSRGSKELWFVFVPFQSHPHTTLPGAREATCVIIGIESLRI